MEVQQIRNLLTDLGIVPGTSGSLVRDRAGQFTASFDRSWPIRYPGRRRSTPEPRGDSYAERSVLTTRTKITDRMLIFGERHLRTILAPYETLATDGDPIAVASSARPAPATRR